MPLGAPVASRLTAATALLCACVIVGPLRSQEQVRPATPDQTSNQKTEREQELEKLRLEQRKAADNETRLRTEVESLGQDRRQLGRALIETATRLRDTESRISAAEGRVQALDGNESAIRKTLESRRAGIAELLAALQRMSRRPPPALFVPPEDALESVRAAILLGTLLPEMRTEAETLAQDLTELVRVRRELVLERETLARDLAGITDERRRMTLLVEERQKRQAETEKALESERQRAAGLSRQVDNLKDLLAKLNQDGAAARNLQSPLRESIDQAARTSRQVLALAPAMSFSAAKRALPLPVSGAKIRDFGSNDGLGGTQKGLSIAARPSAQVTAPCDGRVVYAGTFRSYGQLLILDAGGGYHVLLAGMERISVDLGQFVLTGEPVAMMGSAANVAVAATGSSQPVLYVEFRKDGTPVDPGPWWAITDSEKVRG
jgi:murein hydrolase activator